MRNQLEIRSVCKSYKDKKVLNNINLSLENGVYGILGPNGAGKTTLLNIIATILKSDEGELLWNDSPITKCLEEYRSIIGFLPQNLSFYSNYTGRYFLKYMAKLKGVDSSDTERVLDIVHLNDVGDKKIRTYSGGMKRRLGIAQAMLGNPKLVLFDEPTVGLDLEERAAFKAAIKKMGENSIVILSTHIVSDVEEVSDKIVFIKGGQVCKTLVNEEITNIEEYYLSL